MTGSIFLSASIPSPDSEFAKTADSIAIASAISALVYVTLGRRRLVWGGHPAITPMIWTTAEGLGVDYGGWVTLYQSKFFEEAFPEENRHFNNVIYTPSINNKKDSVSEMRLRMLSDCEFSAAVFIGGMSGILDEYKLFRELHPRAGIVPVTTTGGATLEISKEVNDPEKLFDEYDYISLFHRHLEIGYDEGRNSRPS